MRSSAGVRCRRGSSRGWRISKNSSKEQGNIQPTSSLLVMCLQPPRGICHIAVMLLKTIVNSSNRDSIACHGKKQPANWHSIAQVSEKNRVIDTQLHRILEKIAKLALNCTTFFWIIVQLGATVPTCARNLDGQQTTQIYGTDLPCDLGKIAGKRSVNGSQLLEANHCGFQSCHSNTTVCFANKGRSQLGLQSSLLNSRDCMLPDLFDIGDTWTFATSLPYSLLLSSWVVVGNAMLVFHRIAQHCSHPTRK
jgi:hypothetical protein